MATCNLANMQRFIIEAEKRYQALAKNSQRPHRSIASTTDTLPTATLEQDWQLANQAMANGDILAASVIGWNRGGLLVRWNELQGFIPSSQLHDVTVFSCDEPRIEKLATWVGQQLDVKVIEVDQERNRLVFSERATAWGPHDGELLLAEIRPGETRSGRVSNLCDFGAFVDLGGIDGLIHLSELSWRRIGHPREVLEIGQETQVYIIDVDRENHRVALSLKRLQPNPWTVVESKYHVGQDITAVVTNIVDFGVFAQIEDGLEGLVHISELPEVTPPESPTATVEVGDQIRVRIMRIDARNNRLGLSIRQADMPLSEQPQVLP
ncbi:MAG: 30S ribosomal protein S1 [Chloroflexi bacterium]|nr:30S ribosomal protein S1 [Chloroflexota bacterium]